MREALNKNSEIIIITTNLNKSDRLVLGLEEFAKCIHPELFENETKKQS